MHNIITVTIYDVTKTYNSLALSSQTIGFCSTTDFELVSQRKVTHTRSKLLKLLFIIFAIDTRTNDKKWTLTLCWLSVVSPSATLAQQ